MMWSRFFSKLFAGNLRDALDILFGGDGTRDDWPFSGESGDDDPLPGGDPPEIKPPVVVAPNPMPLCGCFAMCVRFAVDTAKRALILDRLPLVRIGQWEQRRGETDTIETLAERMASMAQMAGERRLLVGMDWFEYAQPGYVGGGDAQRWGRLILAALKPYWHRVDFVELCDEPSASENLVEATQIYRALEVELGLERKPLSVTVCTDPAYVGKIPEVDIIAIEAYARNPMEANDLSAETAKGHIILGLEDAAARVKATGKKLGLIVQTYARNPHETKRWNLWNFRVLVAQAQAGMQWALDHKQDVEYVMCFSAGRASGFADPGAPDVWDALWTTVRTFSEKWAGAVVDWPALPPDPRPGEPVRVEIRRIRIVDHFRYHGPNDPPNEVTNPNNQGESAAAFELRFFGPRGEWSNEDIEKRGWHKMVKWTATAGTDTATVEPGKVYVDGKYSAWNLGSHSQYSEGDQWLVILPACPVGTVFTISAWIASLNGRQLWHEVVLPPVVS